MSDYRDHLLDRLVEELLAEVDEHHGDPGPERYDAALEDKIRSLMELTAYYDEAGPRADPDGRYLCGTCELRQGETGCLFVAGPISLTRGSCDIYVHGIEPLPVGMALKEKFSQARAGYVERPLMEAFGCSRCEYGIQAAEADVDGRELWCREWGVHVRPGACCSRHDGEDMIEAPGEETENEV